MTTTEAFAALMPEPAEYACIGGVSQDFYTAEQMRAMFDAATERAAKQVPMSWIDSMLTGPNAVPGIATTDGRVIEELLRRVAAAIRNRDGGTQG